MAPRGSGGPGPGCSVPRWQSLEPEPPPPEGPEDTSLEASRGGPGSQSLNWASAGRRSGEAAGRGASAREAEARSHLCGPSSEEADQRRWARSGGGGPGWGGRRQG